MHVPRAVSDVSPTHIAFTPTYCMCLQPTLHLPRSVLPSSPPPIPRALPSLPPTPCSVRLRPWGLVGIASVGLCLGVHDPCSRLATCVCGPRKPERKASGQQAGGRRAGWRASARGERQGRGNRPRATAYSPTWPASPTTSPRGGF